jgi:hypothetical protein
MKKLLMIPLILIGCGQQPAAAPSTQAAAVTTTTSTVASFGAQLVKDKKEFECTDKNNGQLIYDQSTKGFFYCNTDNWVSIDLAGKDGKDGTNGIDGVAGVNGKDGTDGATGTGIAGTNGTDGKNGIDGKDGTNGTNGIDGQKGSAAFAFDWTDTVTGKSWLIKGWDILTSGATCGYEYHTPTEAEARAAVTDGLLDSGAPKIILTTKLFVSQNNYVFQWLDASDETNMILKTMTIDSPQMVGVYCVK